MFSKPKTYFILNRPKDQAKTCYKDDKFLQYRGQFLYKQTQIDGYKYTSLKGYSVSIANQKDQQGITDELYNRILSNLSERAIQFLQNDEQDLLNWIHRHLMNTYYQNQKVLNNPNRMKSLAINSAKKDLIEQYNKCLLEVSLEKQMCKTLYQTRTQKSFTVENHFVPPDFINWYIKAIMDRISKQLLEEDDYETFYIIFDNGDGNHSKGHKLKNGKTFNQTFMQALLKKNKLKDLSQEKGCCIIEWNCTQSFKIFTLDTMNEMLQSFSLPEIKY